MISHHHRTVFVHIPKCGGMSVEHMFLTDLGLEWDQRAPLLLRARVEAEVAPPRLAHLTATEYVEGHYLSQWLWDEYLTFAVVRNPFGRVESCYRYLGFDRMLGFDAFVNGYLPRVMADPAHPWRWFLRPQAEFFTRDGQVAVDHLVPLERLEQELPAVLTKAGILEAQVPHVNQGRRLRMRRAGRLKLGYLVESRRLPRVIGSFPVKWTVETRQHVAEMYAEDFVLGGYSAEAD